MTHAASTPELGTVERLLTRLQEQPWDATYRIAIGLAIIPSLSRTYGRDVGGWVLALAFAAVLLALRCVPALLRRMIPISESLQAAWADRRQLAKRYDSYQWQKLFWFGIGLSLHMALIGPAKASHVILALTCLATGGVGLAIWTARRVALEATLASHRGPNR